MTTLIAQEKLSTVLGIYDAFGRGDVAEILDRLDEHVEWDHGLRPTSLPWLQPLTGRDQIVGFFTALGEGLSFTQFEVGEPCVGPTTVIVPVVETAVATRTGKHTRTDIFVHIWTFGENGLVTSFRHVGDWAIQEEACSVEGADGA